MKLSTPPIRLVLALGLGILLACPALAHHADPKQTPPWYTPPGAPLPPVPQSP
jgi:hypothetical protein